eukprot:4979292-Amphidinium_carterae.1
MPPATQARQTSANDCNTVSCHAHQTFHRIMWPLAHRRARPIGRTQPHLQRSQHGGIQTFIPAPPDDCTHARNKPLKF